MHGLVLLHVLHHVLQLLLVHALNELAAELADQPYVYHTEVLVLELLFIDLAGRVRDGLVINIYLLGVERVLVSLARADLDENAHVVILLVRLQLLPELLVVHSFLQLARDRVVQHLDDVENQNKEKEN